MSHPIIELQKLFSLQKENDGIVVSVNNSGVYSIATKNGIEFCKSSSNIPIRSRVRISNGSVFVFEKPIATYPL